MTDDQRGNYSYPLINTWDYPASNDCQRITPEPQDGSSPVYVKDDDMLQLLMVLLGMLKTRFLSRRWVWCPLESRWLLVLSSLWPQCSTRSHWSWFQSINYPSLISIIPFTGSYINVNLTTIFPTTYQAEIFYPTFPLLLLEIPRPVWSTVEVLLRMQRTSDGVLCSWTTLAPSMRTALFILLVAQLSPNLNIFTPATRFVDVLAGWRITWLWVCQLATPQEYDHLDVFAFTFLTQRLLLNERRVPKSPFAGSRCFIRASFGNYYLVC